MGEEEGRWGAQITWSLGFLLQEGAEGGADGAAAEGLLHAEVVHHALLHFLLGRGEQQAAEHGQLPRTGRERKSERNVKSKQVSPVLAHTPCFTNGRVQTAQ